MTAPALTVLIIGGYGTFGGRLVELLAHERELKLIVAGRSQAHAAALCARLAPKAAAALVALAFDRAAEVEGQLARIDPRVVVDASGPFQAYGGDPYALVRACLLRGIDYLDLADGTDFVRGISAFDAAARARGGFVLSGVSTFPVLSAAAVRQLMKPIARLETITAGLAPSPFARVGLNVVRAIASYAGKPIDLVREGRKAFGHGLIDARRYTIAAPGRVPLRPTRFSLVDVPDLKLLPEHWPGLRAIWTGAGPVPEVYHRALTLLARAVRARLIPSLDPLARLMHWMMNRLVWGEHRGGMFVAVEGVDRGGAPVARSWEMIAEGDDGPFIPSMAAAALVGRVLRGQRPEPGARSAVAELELADYAPLFAKRKIFAGEWQMEPAPAALALYRRLLGEAWHWLPVPLRIMHDVEGEVRAEGFGEVEHGRGLLRRLLAFAFGFPPAGREIPVRVSLVARDGRETWHRTFGTRSFTSVQAQGEGAFARLLCERFGPFTFGFALVIEDDRLRFVIRRWSLLGLPLPRWLAPRGDSYEFVANDRFNFHVEIGHPLIGLIVRYRGWLVPSLRSERD